MEKISNGEGCVEDFKKMYKNVDAVVDTPVFLYWYEIHRAFPDAKVCRFSWLDYNRFF